jgi:hypothetical protein
MDSNALCFAAILPAEGASEECDSAVQAVNEVVQRLDDVLCKYKKELGYVPLFPHVMTTTDVLTLLLPPHSCKNLAYWHSSIGTKDVYQIQAPTSFKPPANWTKQAGTKVGRPFGPLSGPPVQRNADHSLASSPLTESDQIRDPSHAPPDQGGARSSRDAKGSFPELLRAAASRIRQGPRNMAEDCPVSESVQP